MHHEESERQERARSAMRAGARVAGARAPRGRDRAQSKPTSMLHALTLPLAVAATLACASPGAAQPAPARRALVPLLGAEDDARRDAQLSGAGTDGYLLRGAADEPAADAPRFALLVPYLRVSTNSTLPFSLNDGAAWAGRGGSGLVRAGARARVGRVRVVVAPELVVARNAPFEILPSNDPGRSAYASPFHSGRASIDLPSRFGDRPLARVTLGQSMAGLTLGPAELGLSAENAWWGPGHANALVLSGNAEGFPHMFVRTARPVRTPLGDVEARYRLGVLSPSLHLEREILDTQRSFSGAAVTLRPARARGVTLGVTRAVVASVDRDLAVLDRALDVLTLWEAPPANAAERPRGDQLTGAFARWVLPADRVELYGEAVRSGAPRELRELLLAPQDGRAYTLGARVLRPLGPSTRGVTPDRYLRLAVELTDAERSVALRDRLPPEPLYTGLATREGYTQRGQVIGAAIGPGGSSQLLSADHVTAATSLGLALGRIRWENDALYDQPSATFLRHDVSTLLTARATRRTRLADVRGEATWARRYNYLFQNGFANPGGRRTVDLTNLTFTLAVEPR
jgi:hypothetical protein